MARYRSTGILRAVAREMERNAKERAREEARQQKIYKKDHARRTMEDEKQRALDLARKEVELFENQIESLRTLHRVSLTPVDWSQLACRLQPVEPLRIATATRKQWRRECLQNIMASTAPPPLWKKQGDDAPQEEAFRNDTESWERGVRLASRVIDGEEQAYVEALNEFSTLNDITACGYEIEFSFHSPSQFEISVEMRGAEVIPEEIKSLRSSGKLSVKKMPRKIQSELYQDHMFSCILRTARETFAVLPISELLLNAHAPVLDLARGEQFMQIVCSVVLTRRGLESLDMDNLSPSEGIASFPHNKDFKASRKSGAFQAIQPLFFREKAPETEFLGIKHLQEKVTCEIASLLELTSHEDINPIDEDDE